MKVDTVESLGVEFAILMQQHDIAWQEYRSRQAVVGKKFEMTGVGAFAGNPTAAEIQAEDAAWQRVIGIKSRIDGVLQRLQAVL